jgi:3-methylcrotonyl-CoA carboxylase alpha subunit
MFTRVLIANRGEIACRIIATLHRLGIEALAVHSDADRDARHVALADRALRIGPPPASESYLKVEAILEAAAASGAEAVHPGYGFLAENAAFARACGEAGLVFIGPSPEVIALMGEKDRAKAAVAAVGVPVVPGFADDDGDDARLLEAARAIGFPVLIKAAAGGGGKGMRAVHETPAFRDALAGARREAQAAFGDARVILERLIQGPRHVEVQVFGDRQGNVVHLFERDCSLQRRHQKVIEEAPAPGLGDELRRALGATAVRAAQAIGYTGAGTVEFLLEADGSFHFIEMNTRLQVEHPVTEMITGQDLVEWQLRVAAGEPLPVSQDQIPLRGHAIEARLYAEDPARGFLPSIGRLRHLRFPPEGPELRIETGVREGDEVSPHYDPMIAKLVAWGPDRSAALGRLRAALAASDVLGPATNLAFLERVVAHPAMAAGGITTGFLDGEGEELAGAALPDARAFACAALWLLAEQRQQAQARAAQSADPHSPWWRVDGWRLNDVSHQTLRLGAGEQRVEVDATLTGDGWHLDLGDRAIAGRLRGARVELDGVSAPLRVVRDGRRLDLTGPGGRFRLELIDPLAEAVPADEAGGIFTAPMPGKVLRRLVEAGAQVAKGAPLLVLEAMKMEHTVAAPATGRVRALHVEEGEQVEEGTVLLDFESMDPSPAA